jgi:hypothetical protein
VTAQQALKASLRDVLGPVARNHGYKGSAPNWRKSSPSGDWSVVNIQSSSASTAGKLRCVVNLAFAPEPWLRWQAEKLGAGMPKLFMEYLGLFRQRLHPEGTPEGTDAWWVVSDEESAHRAVTDMNAQLERAGWPVLEGMFSRDAMMARLRDDNLGWARRSNFEGYFASAEALLLMDAGPSAALESRLTSLESNATPGRRATVERFEAWVRAQAAKA